MSDRKTVLRHGLANLMTTITILVADSGLKPAEKGQIEFRARMAGMILAYEKIFLGKRQPFLREIVDISDLLRIMCKVFGKPRDLDKLEKRLTQASLRVVADRNGLGDALELIFRKWRSDNVPLDFEIDVPRGRLTFLNGPKTPLDSKGVDLLDLLQRDIESPDWGFQLAMRILEMNNVQVSFRDERMILGFPLGEEMGFHRIHIASPKLKKRYPDFLAVS